MNHLKITDLRVGTKLSYWYQRVYSDRRNEHELSYAVVLKVGKAKVFVRTEHNVQKWFRPNFFIAVVSEQEWKDAGMESKLRPTMYPCRGRSPTTGKRVGIRHRWSADVCDFCGRTKDEARQCYS